MGPNWAMTSLQKSYFESSIAGGRSVVYNTKSQETQNNIDCRKLASLARKLYNMVKPPSTGYRGSLLLFKQL